jgi:hypothetical protein
VDGLEGSNHLVYFSITDMPSSHLTCAKGIPISLETLALLTMMVMNNHPSKLWIPPTGHILYFISKVSHHKAHTYIPLLDEPQKKMDCTLKNHEHFGRHFIPS